MSLTHRVARLAGKLLSPVRAGDEKLAISKLEAERKLRVQASDFVDGGPLPERHAGKAASPPGLSWVDPPVDAKELVIVCEDPDAPFPKPFAHWIVYGIPPTTAAYPDEAMEGTLAAPSKTGKNSKGKLGFAGATPPPGHGVHHYHFQVFALDSALSLGAGADRDTVVTAMRGHVLASGEVVGTFEAR
jgi:hypothetical protein